MGSHEELEEEEEEEEERYGAVPTETDEMHYIVKNFLSMKRRPREPEHWLPRGSPKAVYLLQPTLLIEYPFIRRRLAAIHHASGLRPPALRYPPSIGHLVKTYNTLTKAFTGNQLMNDCLKLQKVYEHVVAEVVPLFIAERKLEDLLFLYGFFMVLNHFRRRLHLWNTALSLHFPPFLHRVLRRHPPPPPPPAAPLLPPPPATPLSVVSSHLHCIYDALDPLIDSIHLVAFHCFNFNFSYFKTFYPDEDAVIMATAF